MENKDLDIKVEYVTRVEGHGNIVINVKDGKVEKSEFHVVETPRFFEGMVRGRSIFEAKHITSESAVFVLAAILWLPFRLQKPPWILLPVSKP